MDVAAWAKTAAQFIFFELKVLDLGGYFSEKKSKKYKNRSKNLNLIFTRAIAFCVKKIFLAVYIEKFPKSRSFP